MIAEVIVDVATSEIDRVFDYEVGLLQVHVGHRVLVPFGKKFIEGFVIRLKEKSNFNGTLKSISKVLDEYVTVSEELLSLMDYMTKKYNLRKIDVLRLYVPPRLRGGKIKELTKNYVTLNTEIDYDDMVSSVSQRAKSQLAVLEYLRSNGEWQAELNKKFSPSAVNSLSARGYLVIESVRVERKPEIAKEANAEKKLTDSQQDAVEKILADDKIKLLYGVTGSGKTEVYLHCIKRVLDMGKTAIMLVPEIALTPQMSRLVTGRFGDLVAILHSGLNDGERFDEWERILTGKAKIVIGARSAIFAPIQNVGLIIIDEEHDQSYVSESNPRYDTKSVAEERAKYNKCPLVLGSATPSIESYLYAKYDKYTMVRMPNRVNNRNMPDMQIVDMVRSEKAPNSKIFSLELYEALRKVIEEKNQAMIFINRRGFSSFIMCRDCGYVAKCADCDVSLTYHKAENVLKCHYCGKKYRVPDKCPQCGSEKIRMGKIGTETVVKELEQLFGGVKILRMDNDTTSTKDAHQKILSEFSKGEAQILVGTQMIAKGHDFPNVTLVGILDADASLYFSDYRSTERTFQLITQVAGRAGRADKEGKVIVQTYSPRHYVFRYAKEYDYDGFFEKENNARKITKFPPYTTILRIMVTSTIEDDAIDLTQKIFNKVGKVKQKYADRFIYCQAMKSPLNRMQTKYRYQVLMRIKKKNDQEIIDEIYQITNEYNKEKNCWVFVENNPQSLI